jgi:hypothetical protein
MILLYKKYILFLIVYLSKTLVPFVETGIGFCSVLTDTFLIRETEISE